MKKRSKDQKITGSPYQGERIAKVIARAGVCSRREAERLIHLGRVSINGTILDTPAITVKESDHILVDGHPLPEKQDTRLFILHKQADLVTTAKDERGRATVFDVLSHDLPRLISVGRLDINTEGLLLLTNDGELARYLELPETGWKRRYRVRAFGKITQERLSDLKKGIEVDGMRYGSIEATLEKVQGDNSWITMTLTEGKNREIRKVMEALGLKVNRLIRISYGPFHLGDLAKGAVKEVPEKVMKDQIKGFLK